MKKVEIYLRSVVIASDLEALMVSYDYHYNLETSHREIYHWLRDQGWSKGRLFDLHSAELLPLVERLVEQPGITLVVYDVSSLGIWIKALLRGAWRLPAVFVDGKRSIGLANSRQALETLL